MNRVKLTLHVRGHAYTLRTATARNVSDLTDICRRWMSGHGERIICAEYMESRISSPYGMPHDAVAEFFRAWATELGWRPEQPEAAQREVLMPASRVPAGLDVEKVSREALDNGPAPASAVEIGQRVHEAIEREVVRMNTPERGPERGPERAMDAPGYEHLAAVLVDAYEQAAYGKGKERHANDLPFDHQPMQAISRLLGNPTGMTYQACKKVVEAMNMKDRAARRRELLGAIVYLAGVVVYEDNGRL